MKLKGKAIQKHDSVGKSNPPKKILIDIFILSIIMLAAYVLPFASYTYKKVKYTISGIDFIVGKTVAGGKVVVPTNVMLSVAVVAIVSLLLIALISKKLKAKVSSGIITLLGIFVVVGNINLSMQLSKILKGVKNIGIAYGSVILIVLGITVVVRGFYFLWKEKSVSTLDFMVIPGMLYFL